MEKIKKIMKCYKNSIYEIESKQLKKHERLKSKIKISKYYVQELRVYVRSNSFDRVEDEISFFKNIKPQISGNLNFYRRQLEYIQEKPKITVKSQKEHIKKGLRKLQIKKNKHLYFYRYLKQEETALDEIYFTRGKEQLELFSFSDFIDTDADFTTSHDLLAGEVIAYDLLTEFYKQELYCLSNIENIGFKSHLNSNENNFTWSGSKTDLVELIYALKVSGVINSGDVTIKQLTGFFGEAFNVDLINYYKTYNEIRNRAKIRTKFLSKLSLNLEHKLEMDEI